MDNNRDRMRPAVSQYYALRLLQATLDDSLYELAGELVRFLLRSGRESEHQPTEEGLSHRIWGFLFPVKKQCSDLNRNFFNEREMDVLAWRILLQDLNSLDKRFYVNDIPIREIKRTIEMSNGGGGFPSKPMSLYAAKIVWWQTEAAHTVTLIVPPNMRNEDVNVMIEEGKVLRIEECAQSCKAAKAENRHPFMERLAIPCNAEVDGVRAEMMEESVLTVTVPKKKRVIVVETKKIVVKVGERVIN